MSYQPGHRVSHGSSQKEMRAIRPSTAGYSKSDQKKRVDFEEGFFAPNFQPKNSFSGHMYTEQSQVGVKQQQQQQLFQQQMLTKPFGIQSNAISMDISRLKDDSIRLLRQNRIAEALEKLPALIETAAEYFGKESQQFSAIFQETLQVFCDYSMRILSKNEFEKAIDILSVCNSLTVASKYHEQVPEKRILVLNNQGCVFRKMGRLGKARIFLEEALSLVQKFPSIKYSGVTYMNICAVVSQAGMRDRALAYARQGLYECQRILMDFVQRGAGPNGARANDGSLEEKVKFTAISFHNVAVEEEYLKNYDKAKECFRSSFTLFEEHGLSLTDPIYLKFKESYSRCVQNSLQQPANMRKTTGQLQVLNQGGSNLGGSFDKGSSASRTAQLSQTSQDGFYFQNNKLMSKQPKQSDKNYSASAQLMKTQPINRGSNQFENSQFDQIGFRQTVKKNNFFDNNDEYDIQHMEQSQQQQQHQPAVMNLRGSVHSARGSSRKSSQRASPSRRQSVEGRKEIEDLNLVGVLNWSESGESDEDIQISRKKDRLDFLKAMQGEDAEVKENSLRVEAVKDRSFNIDEQEQIQSPRRSVKSVKSVKSVQSVTSVKSIKSPPPQLSHHSLKSKPFNFYQTNQQQDIQNAEDEQDEEDRDDSQSPAMKKQTGASLQKLQSKKTLKTEMEYDARVSNRESKRASLHNGSQIDFDLDEEADQEMYEKRIYNEIEVEAAIQIQRAWRKIIRTQILIRTKVMQNKQKLLLMRRKKAQKAILVIQRSVRVFLAYRHSQENAKISMISRDWTTCLQTVDRIREAHEAGPDQEFWRFRQQGSNQDLFKLRLFKINASYDRGLRYLRIQLTSKDHDKSQGVSKNQIVIDLYQIQRSHTLLNSLRVSSSEITTPAGIKLLAQKLQPYILIFGDSIKISVGEDLISDEQFAEPEEEAEEIIYVPRKTTRKQREAAALKIQSYYRRKQSMKTYSLKRNQNVKVLRKWAFKTEMLKNCLFSLKFLLKPKEGEYKFFLKELDQKLVFPQLKLNNAHVPAWQNHRVKTGISNYFDIDKVDETFDYSGLFFKSLGFRNTYQKSGALTDAKDEYVSDTFTMQYYESHVKKIIKIQSFFRGTAVRKIYAARIAKIREQHINNTDFEGENLIFICRSGYVFETIEPFLLQMFYKPAISRINSTAGNVSHISKNMQAQVIINCLTLNRKSIFGTVETVKQKASPEITVEILQRYGPKMLKYTHLKLIRNVFKMVVPNISSVMQEAANEIMLREGKEVKIHDPDFKQKHFFSKRTALDQRKQYRSLVNFCEFDANQSKNFLSSEIREHCRRTIFYKYLNFQDHRKVEILTTKGIKDHSQLKKKAQLDFPSTEYSKSILKFMENNRQNLDENTATKPKIDAQLIALNKPCKIGEDKFSIDVYYDANERQVIVISQSVEKQASICQLIINISSLAMHDWNLEALKENIDEVVLNQLRHRNYVLYFEENKQVKKKQEFVALEIDEDKQRVIEEMAKRHDDLENGVQEFLFNLHEGHILIEVFFNLKLRKLILSLSQKQVTHVKANIDIKLAWFGCSGLLNIVDSKTPEELEAFFFPLISNMRKDLEISWDEEGEQYHFKIEQMQRAMPTIIKNYFASKLQKRFLTKLIQSRFKFSKQVSQQPQILLNTDVVFSSNYYFEKRWYLLKELFQLTLVIEKYPKVTNKSYKKVFSVDLKKLKQTFSDLSSSKASKGMSGVAEQQQFMIKNQWTDIEGLHSKGYFEKIFGDLIFYMNKTTQISIIYQKIFVQMLDTRIELNEEKQLSQKKKDLLERKKQGAYEKFRMIISAVSCVQRTYRKFKKQEWQMLKAERKKEMEAVTKQLGPRVKRAFVSVDGCMYIANVYQQENTYVFDLILYNDRREKKIGNRTDVSALQQSTTTGGAQPLMQSILKKKKKKQIRGVYEYDSNILLNIGSQSIPDYLLDRITIQDEDIVFKESMFIEHQPEAYQKVKRNEADLGLLERNNQVNQNSNEQRSLVQSKEAASGNANIASNLVNYLNIESDGQQYIYNVLYTGDKPKKVERKVGKSVRRESLIAKNFMNELLKPSEEGQVGKTSDESDQQTVKINVDLNELKKLYPSVDQKSSGLMKVIGEQLVDGIKLNEQGKIEIDASKINPKCIEVSENTVQANELQSYKSKIEQQQKSKIPLKLIGRDSSEANAFKQQQLLSQEQALNENKKILLKQTRFFSKQKYLILIYNIERKVKKINAAQFDSVFEEYEVLYQVNCINLASKSSLPILWEISPEEIMVTSEGVKDNMERARFLMRHIQIFNQKIIYTVLKKSHINKIRPNPIIIVYYEAGLIPIQNHFRNRKFRRNHQMFKEEIRMCKDQIIHRCIPEELRSQTQYYLLVVVEIKDQKDTWEIIVWDMNSFERFSTQVKSADYINQLAEFGRQVTVEFIAKFIEITPQSSELTMNSGILEFFKKCREDLKKKKVYRDIVEKKKLNYLS